MYTRTGNNYFLFDSVPVIFVTPKKIKIVYLSAVDALIPATYAFRCIQYVLCKEYRVKCNVQARESFRTKTTSIFVGFALD
jgi:hypothetical protein